jgi:hypothetical protein
MLSEIGFAAMPDTSESGPVWSVTVAGASSLGGAVVMNAW